MRSLVGACWVLAALLLATRSADARELLVGDGNRIIRLDLATGATVGVISGPEMVHIEGIAFGPDGSLYVADYGSAEILKYDGTTFVFQGVFRSGPELQGPVDLTFGPDGKLYVANQGTYGVLTYDISTGQPVDLLPVPQVDGSFSGPGYSPDWTFPTGIAVAADGTIYLSGGQQFFDYLLRKRPLGVFETFVTDHGCANGSFDVVVAPNGDLYFSDAGEGCVTRVDPVTGGTTFVTSGSNNSGLAVDADGSLFNYDGGSVLRFDPTGAPLVAFQSGATQPHSFIAVTPAVKKPPNMPIAWPAPIPFPGHIPSPPGRP